MNYVLWLCVCYITKTTSTNDKNNYLVLLDDNLSLNASSHFSSSMSAMNAFETVDAKIEDVYENVNAYKAFMSSKAAQYLQNNPGVKYVEIDQTVQLDKVQYFAPWGLSRISQRGKVSHFDFMNKYKYHENAGKDVNIYVIDSGINLDHNDFEGRAVYGEMTSASDTIRDLNGHGTHCAGIAAGKKYGVAKKAQVIGVKAFNDDGSSFLSMIIKSIDYVLKDVVNFGGKKGNVVSMSLSAGNSSIMNEAVERAVNKGLVVVAAAGNYHQDACNYSPSAAKSAITVGSTNKNDEMSSFSNYGNCVDIFAPGEDIISAWIGSNSSVRTNSGTSMAAPHVAGLAAAIMSQLSVKLSPLEVKNMVIERSTKGIIKGIEGGTPNQLAYNPPH